MIPELADPDRRWPYAVAGVAFAAYGIALISYGSHRRRKVDRALDEGGFPEPLGLGQGLLIGSGLLLGAITVALVLVG